LPVARLTAERRLGDGEDGVLVGWPRQTHDHLADVDDLTRLGTDRRDDAIELGDEIGVATAEFVVHVLEYPQSAPARPGSVGGQLFGAG
jgi:hypothetical protein